ncbi:family 3 glycoside hydrolase, partial [Reticulomyxa filosa]
FFFKKKKIRIECLTYPGFAGAQAIVSTIAGDNNPGGKMAVTMYWSNYTSISNFEVMDLTEGCGKTYKYFKYGVLYPFAWGISYTQFSFQWAQNSTCNSPNGLNYCIYVKNVGSRKGTETIFLFVIPPSTIPSNESASSMKKHVISWTKIELLPQQTYYYQFTLNTTKDLTLYDNNGNGVIYDGQYTLSFTNGVDQNLQASYTVDSLQIVEKFPAPEQF